MGFTFVRPKINHKGIEIQHNWMLKVDSLETLNAYMDTVQRSIIKNGLMQFPKDYEFHCTDSWEYLVEIGAGSRGTSIIEESCRLEDQVYQTRIKMVLNHGGMYLNENGGGFPFSDSVDEVETLVKENLEYPEYTEDDIRIIKWPDGTHYYAKVGSMDVVVRGVQKWDSEYEARKNAKSWLQSEQRRAKGKLW